MKESVYVIRRDDGVKFCVNKEHYENYKERYFLVKPTKVESPPPSDSPSVDKPTRTNKKTKE
jgi:hypothetical protein